MVLGNTSFQQLLVGGAAVVAVLATGWLALVAVAALVEAATAGRCRVLRFTGCPVEWRRRLLRLLVPLLAPGLGVAAPLTAQAVSDHGRPGHAGHPEAGSGALTGLPLPDRQRNAPRDGPRRDRVIRVRAGDTLWAIALGTLPAHSDPAAVARRCRQIHRANRDVIGDDPDLILPGQRLRVRIPHLEEDR